MILSATFTSVWDGGFKVSTKCKVNEDTKEVFDIEVSENTGDFVNELDEEFITIGRHDYPVVSKEYLDSDAEEAGSYWYE